MHSTKDAPAAPGGVDGARAPGYRDNVMTVTLEEDGRRTRWKLVTRFRSLAERDAALGIGFTAVLGEGTEKFNDLVRALSVDPKHLGSRA